MAISLRGIYPAARVPARLNWRHLIFAAVLAAYVALTLAVVIGSPLTMLDQDVLHLDLMQRWPGLHRWISAYVVLGQRGPSTLVALPWVLWRARRLRSVQPIIRLGVALFLLNTSVGVVKIATGRLGPLRTVHASAVFYHQGTIFPSGHVSNAVVLFGLLAWMACEHRRFALAAAVFVPVTVGLGTIYLDTHWLTDVVGGWLAGGLVLLALPTVMPTAERWTSAAIGRLGRLRRRGAHDGAHADRAVDGHVRSAGDLADDALTAPLAGRALTGTAPR